MVAEQVPFRNHERHFGPTREGADFRCHMRGPAPFSFPAQQVETGRRHVLDAIAGRARWWNAVRNAVFQVLRVLADVVGPEVIEGRAAMLDGQDATSQVTLAIPKGKRGRSPPVAQNGTGLDAPIATGWSVPYGAN